MRHTSSHTNTGCVAVVGLVKSEATISAAKSIKAHRIHVSADELFITRRVKVKLKQIHKKAEPHGSTVCRHNGSRWYTNSSKHAQKKAHNRRRIPMLLWGQRFVAAASFARLGFGQPLFTARWPQQDLQGPTDSDSACLSGLFRRAVNRCCWRGALLGSTSTTTVPWEGGGGAGEVGGVGLPESAGGQGGVDGLTLPATAQQRGRDGNGWHLLASQVNFYWASRRC